LAHRVTHSPRPCNSTEARLALNSDRIGAAVVLRDVYEHTACANELRIA